MVDYTTNPVLRTAAVSDKLAIINDALLATGNNPVQQIDDASDEWKIANAAYERFVPVLLEERNWKFATQVAALTRLGDSDVPGYSDVYSKPPDCLRFLICWRPDVAGFVYPTEDYLQPQTRRNPPDLDFQIVGDNVHVVAPNGVSCKYIPFPVGAQPWSIGFVEALRLKIEAACYRGLNSDYELAAATDKMAALELAKAAQKCDAEEPRRPAFRSSLVERRRRRVLGYFPQ